MALILEVEKSRYAIPKNSAIKYAHKQVNNIAIEKDHNRMSWYPNLINTYIYWWVQPEISWLPHYSL